MAQSELGLPKASVKSRGASYRPEIDGLRAVAVLAVMINHFDPDLLPGGYLGVDVFFVISGCVITASLMREERAVGMLSMMTHFYRRRVKRIQPALVVCVAVVSLFICFFNPSPDQSLWTGLASLAGASNIYLLDKSTDYFASSSELNPFLHTWSLGVEEQFYLLYPILVLSILRVVGPRFGMRVLGGAVLALSAFSLVVFLCIYSSDQNFVYYMMPARAWELGAGCLCQIWMLQKGSRGSRALGGHRTSNAFWPSLMRGDALLLIVILVAMFLSPEMGQVSTPLVVLASSLLLVFVKPGSVVWRFLRQSTLLHLGLLSYSLYLWHWPIISLSRWTIGIHWWSVPFQALIIYCLARLSYEWVESPLRMLSWSRHWKAVCLGPGVLALSAVGVVAFSQRMPGGSLYLGNKNKVASMNESLVEPYRIPGTAYQWDAGKCTISDPSQRPRLSFEECVIGGGAGFRRRVVVFGDSFAGAYIRAFDELVREDKAAVSVVSVWGGSPAPGVSSGLASRQDADHYIWQKVAPGFVDALGPGDWFFLVDDLASMLPRRMTAKSTARLEQLRRGLLALSAAVDRRGARLAVLHANPFVRDAHCQPISAQPQWFNLPGNPPCAFLPREVSLIRRAPLDQMMRQLERQNKLRVVDLFDHFCPLEICTYETGVVPLLYRDEWSHPSNAAVRSVAADVRSALNRP